jgi:HSP20 family protein
MKLITLQTPDVSVWPAVGRLFGLRNELDHLFAGSLSELATRGAELLNIWNPAVDLYEDKDNVFVKAELPGMKKEAIDVSLHDGVLTISGERKGESKGENAEEHRSERFEGRFSRSLALPSEVQADKVEAQYKDGILHITLPKAEAAKRKQIEVKID